MLRLNQIRDFLTVLECGSIRSAAAKLDVTQPAVTKSLRSLEVAVGIELLHRTSSGVTPTAAGAAFAARARVAQRELDRAQEEATARRSGTGLSLNIGIGSVPIALGATRALVAFRADHPDGRLRVIEGPGHTLLPLVRDGTIDVALAQRVDPSVAPGLKYRPLLRTRMVVVARRGHPRSQARSLAQLRDVDWIVYRPPKAEGVLEAAMRAEGLPYPSRYVHCESFALTLALIRSSDLVGIVVPQALSDPTGSLLQEISLKRPLPELSVGMYRRADAPVSAAMNDFWVHLVRQVRELGENPV